MMDKVMVMKEKTMETVLQVTSSPMLSMSEKISGRLKLIWSQNWKYDSIEASMMRARVTKKNLEIQTRKQRF